MTTNQKTEQLRTSTVYLHTCLSVDWTRLYLGLNDGITVISIVAYNSNGLYWNCTYKNKIESEK